MTRMAIDCSAARQGASRISEVIGIQNRFTVACYYSCMQERYLDEMTKQVGDVLSRATNQDGHDAARSSAKREMQLNHAGLQLALAGAEVVWHGVGSTRREGNTGYPETAPNPSSQELSRQFATNVPARWVSTCDECSGFWHSVRSPPAQRCDDSSLSHAYAHVTL